MNMQSTACFLVFGLLTAGSVLAAPSRVESVLGIRSQQDCTELRSALEYSGLDQVFLPGGIGNDTCQPNSIAGSSGYILRLMIDASAFNGKQISSPYTIPAVKCFRAVEAVKSAQAALLTIEDMSYAVEASCTGGSPESHLVLTVTGYDQ